VGWGGGQYLAEDVRMPVPISVSSHSHTPRTPIFVLIPILILILILILIFPRTTHAQAQPSKSLYTHKNGGFAGAHLPRLCVRGPSLGGFCVCAREVRSSLNNQRAENTVFAAYVHAPGPSKEAEKQP
jgi:hypothetical protein